MGNEKKTGMAKLAKPEPDACPLIVSQVKKSIPRIPTVKSKERIKETTSNRRRSTKDKRTTTCETSGNVMRLCVNLMPVLASAKEPVEEEEEREEDNNRETHPSVCKPVEPKHNPCNSRVGLTSERTTETKLSPWFVLPPVTQQKTTPGRCECQRTLTPLPPINRPATTTSPNCTTAAGGGDGAVTERVSDRRPWIDNPLFSNSRSAEFRLPDISLSSLDALLQTVTQKLRRKRRGGDEAPWRQVLVAVSEPCFRETSVRRQDGNLANTGAARLSSRVCRVNRPIKLPPLFSAPKPTLILTMTKKNLLTSSDSTKTATDWTHST